MSAGFLSGGSATQIRKLVWFVLGGFVLERKVVYLGWSLEGFPIFGNTSSLIRFSILKPTYHRSTHLPEFRCGLVFPLL